MRAFIITTIVCIGFTKQYGQTETKNVFNQFYENHLTLKTEEKPLQFFAEVNPQFFAFGGFGAGAGLEFLRVQTGFIYLQTKLTPSFRDVIFNDAKNLDVPKNTAVEIFANLFLRKDRRGFYAGTILSYDGYAVTDTLSKQKENFNKSYLVTRVGFRWFPFQKFVYIDGGYGVSFNLDGAAKRTLGQTTYSHKTILSLPFFAVGGRFLLTRKTKKVN
jgi:hypothetical protein